ncbi:MAG: DUF1566 domain-containing protein [Bacteroidota bacterium]
MDKKFLFPDTGQYLNFNLEGHLIHPREDDPYSIQDACIVINPMHFCKLDEKGNILPEKADWETGLRCVKDLNTGLIWETKSPIHGEINYAGDKYTWEEQSSEYVIKLNKNAYGGHTNWRVPNKDELRSIVDYGKMSPAINQDVFPYIQNDFYWCENTYQMQPYFGWTIYMGFGSATAMSKQSKRNVIAVCEGYQPKFGKMDISRFSDNSDGTVTDNITGLMWQQGDNPRMNWFQALEACKNMNLAGHNDWRLPNIKELNTILNLDRTDGWWYFMDVFPVDNLQPPLLHYFSSSIYNGDFAWVTNFNYGYDGYYAGKLSPLLFRAVRNIEPLPLKSKFVLPDTGQLTCYDDEGNYLKQIKNTEFEGQDGDTEIAPMKFEKLGYNAGILNSDTTSQESWLMVRDKNTGLVWELKSFEKNSLNPYDRKHTYKEAINHIQNLNRHQYGGFSDWRMPNREELRSIVNYNDSIPASDIDIFPEMLPEFYWSCDSYKINPSMQWGIYFGYGCGICFSNSKFYSVRAVRSGYNPAFGNPARYNFSVLDNGVVIDKNTDLMWMHDEPGEMSFIDALKYCKKLDLGGYSDWRLPSMKEIATLVDLSCSDGNWFNKEIFPGVKTKPLGFYWSSSTFAATFGWGVNFQFGYDGYYADKKHGKYCLRPVRNINNKLLLK